MKTKEQELSSVQGTGYKVLVNCVIGGLSIQDEQKYYDLIKQDAVLLSAPETDETQEEYDARQVVNRCLEAGREAERNELREKFNRLKDERVRVFGQLIFSDGRIGVKKFIGYLQDGILQVNTSYEKEQISEDIQVAGELTAVCAVRPTERSPYARIISGDKILYSMRAAAKHYLQEKDSNAEILEVYLNEAEANQKAGNRKIWFSPLVKTNVVALNKVK